MKRYRLHFVATDGSLMPGPREFSAASDAVAIELADGLRDGRRAELWLEDMWLKGFGTEGPIGS